MIDLNRRKNLTAQVHRFSDAVAIHVASGETTYLTPPQARKLARALNKAARDVERTPASASAVTSFTLKIN